MAIKKLILLALVLCFFISCQGQQKPGLHPKSKRSYYLPGDFVSNFSLVNYDGRRVSLNDYLKSKGLVIVFMRNTCEYCQAYEGRIKMLAAKYTPKGYPLIAISPFGDDPQNSPLDDLRHMKTLALRAHFNFPYLSDEKLKITTLFNDQYTPAAYVLQSTGGRMKLLYAGDIDSDWENRKPNIVRYVERSLDSLMRATENPPMKTRK